MKCSLTFEVRVASGVKSEGHFDMKVKVKNNLFQKVSRMWLLSSGVIITQYTENLNCTSSEKDRVLEFSLLGSWCLMENRLRKLLGC